MVRGYLGRTMQFERSLTSEEWGLDEIIPMLAREHAEAMACGHLGMIEIEFLDEPDVNERYFRIGVDPGGMVKPIDIRGPKSGRLPRGPGAKSG
jgi:hypothetical protein